MVGAGAREHALAWAMASSAEVVVTPGNDGMRAHGLTCTSRAATDLEADLFVIGPEQPLVDGLADQLRAQGKRVMGPGSDGAQLEASKAYMKEFLSGVGLPTADFAVFRDVDAATQYLLSQRPPYVIKTDGLAAGKGVLVTDDVALAKADIVDKLSGAAFGEAGSTVVIEEGLSGHECSLMVMCDGSRAWPLAPAQDFKRVGDGDVGANTGGMGAYCPMANFDDHVTDIMSEIVAPTVEELRRRGIDFRGVLYAGVMMTVTGPKLLEYNVRFGDPETQVVVGLYRDSLFDVLLACANGELLSAPVAANRAAVTVVLASRGYPESSHVGDVISGLGRDGQLADPLADVVIFHAGTAQRADGHFVTNGGRVLAVTATGENVARARERAYEACARIDFDGRVMRHDIGAHAAHQGAR